MGRKQPQRNHRVLPSMDHIRIHGTNHFPQFFLTYSIRIFIPEKTKLMLQGLNGNFGDRENLQSFSLAHSSGQKWVP